MSQCPDVSQDSRLFVTGTQKSPWWMKLHTVIYTSWASYWLQEGNACGSLICHLRGNPLRAHLRESADTPLLKRSKLDRVRFPAASSPNPTETTGRTNHSEIWLLHERMPMKKEWCRHWQFTNKTHAPANACLCLTAWESYIGVGIMPEFLRQESMAMVWRVPVGGVVKTLKRNFIFFF